MDAGRGRQSEAETLKQRRRQEGHWRAGVLALNSSAGNAAVAQLLGPSHSGITTISRFGSAEHNAIGADASLGAGSDIDIGNAEKLTYGEVLALAGDFFASVQQMRAMAKTPDGQAELRAARWKALGLGPQPNEAVLKSVMNRYFQLAGSNTSHFSGGGEARATYRAGHRQALQEAFAAGATGYPVRMISARTTEAFCQHFLTDMFAGGHVRAPRRDIKEWYTTHYPDSLNRLLNWASNRIALILDEWGQTTALPNSSIAADIKAKFADLGGPAVQNFSLGDIVGLAYHFQDNKGLGVISDVDESGQPVPGGFHWTAEGDSHLLPAGGQPTASAQLTQRMVTAAARSSLSELETARQLGEQAAGGRCLPSLQLAAAASTALDHMPLAAECFVPRPDEAAGNAVMNWQWGHLDPILRAAVDQSVSGEIAHTLQDQAANVPEFTHLKVVAAIPPVAQTENPGEARWTLHTRRAFAQWAAEMRTLGIVALEHAMSSNASPVPASEPFDASKDGGALPGGLHPSHSPTSAH